MSDAMRELPETLNRALAMADAHAMSNSDNHMIACLIDIRDAAREALAARSVPEGWVVVPREPTPEMLNAAVDVDSFKLGDISPIGFRISPQRLFEKCYVAMLAASPPGADNAQVAPGKPMVKPLEWISDSDRFGCAFSIVGEYRYGIGDDGVTWSLARFKGERCDSIAQAKVAAQADYQQRILSAIDAQVAPAEPAEGEAAAWTSKEALAMLGKALPNMLVWPTKETEHPVPLYASPDREAATREAVERELDLLTIQAAKDQRKGYTIYSNGLNDAVKAIRAALAQQAKPQQAKT